MKIADFSAVGLIWLLGYFRLFFFKRRNPFVANASVVFCQSFLVRTLPAGENLNNKAEPSGIKRAIICDSLSVRL